MADETDRSAPGVGQESVWGYPRPPALEPVDEALRVVFAGETVAETHAGFRVLETSHPPVYYLPPADVRMDLLTPAARRSLCEFKGFARYWTILVGGARAEHAAWSYPGPTERFRQIRSYLAFYASRVDECWVGDERAASQPGDFYGGWITSRVVGPFKGGPGTYGW
jgi:uncharacterized protein (DUF427 family)